MNRMRVSAAAVVVCLYMLSPQIALPARAQAQAGAATPSATTPPKHGAATVNPQPDPEVELQHALNSAGNDRVALVRNLDTMTAALPGPRLRPHVKAHKCTALARHQAQRGHTGFTGATPRELLGLARAGLGDDLLLANESGDEQRLR